VYIVLIRGVRAASHWASSGTQWARPWCTGCDVEYSYIIFYIYPKTRYCALKFKQMVPTF